MPKKKVSKKKLKSAMKNTKNQVKELKDKVTKKDVEVKEVIKMEKKTVNQESAIHNKNPKLAINKNHQRWLTNLAYFALSVGLIYGFVWVQIDYLPEFINSQDSALEQETTNTDQETQNQIDPEQLAKEDKLNFINPVVNIKTNFGGIKATLTGSSAPKHTESFVRLASRDYFDNTIFHRMVEGAEFSVIQGGDPEGTGTGGRSAFGSPIKDELWSVAPEFAQGDDQGSQTIVNDPVFSDPALYQNFDKATGTVVYRKGLLVMAKTAAPDSAGSQFFIVLADTVLPAQYTIFGVIEDSSFAVLDKITSEVDPITDNPDSTNKDGRPNQQITILDVELQ
jgi:cyclophilin family peptidyl-prolyl cis-trans isomerase